MKKSLLKGLKYRSGKSNIVCETEYCVVFVDEDKNYHIQCVKNGSPRSETGTPYRQFIITKRCNPSIDDGHRLVFDDGSGKRSMQLDNPHLENEALTCCLI